MEKVELNTIYLSPAIVDGCEISHGSSGASLLPSNLVEVDSIYLTSSNATGINTNLLFGVDYNSVRLQVKKIAASFSGEGIIAETRGGGSSNTNNFGIYAGNEYLRRNNSWKWANICPWKDDWMDIYADANKWIVDGVEYAAVTKALDPSTTNRTHILNNSNQCTDKIRVRHIIFYLDGVEVSHYVPCKDKKTGLYGMYDVIRRIHSTDPFFAEE